MPKSEIAIHVYQVREIPNRGIEYLPDYDLYLKNRTLKKVLLSLVNLFTVKYIPKNKEIFLNYVT